MSKSTQFDSDIEYLSSPSRFLAPNGIHKPHDFSDTELVAISSNALISSSSAAASYTSLRDILPATPSPPSVISPTHNSSWHEIPIKNPLVKHAAWAYLQPMSTPPESDDTNFFSKLKSVVCCEVGCLEYFKQVVFNVLVIRRDSEEEEEECENEGYCCGRGKVD